MILNPHETDKLAWWLAFAAANGHGVRITETETGITVDRGFGQVLTVGRPECEHDVLPEVQA